MFAVGFSDIGRGEHILADKRVYLRLPQMSDHAAWAELRRSSREFLQPWEPRWHSNDLGRFAYRERVRRYQQDLRRGQALPYFIFNHASDAMMGGITIGQIRRGVSQSGQIGYWMGERYAGKGYMSEALNLVVHHAFTRCGLHRLEAACIPENERSIRLLTSCGFEQEGLLKAYLKINGTWRDHLLFARINPSG